MPKTPKLEISYDAADAITLLVLKDQLKLVKKQTKDHLKKGAYLHPEDLVYNQTKLIPALEVIIHYFGG